MNSSAATFDMETIGSWHTQSYLRRAERGNPDGVWRWPIRQYANRKERGMLQRDRKIQEAKASSRKATGIHNRLDRARPNPNGC
jgi:hypothetical protein